MCTTLLLLSTLAMLWRRRFANRVQPEPSEVGVDGVVAGSSVDTDPQSSGRCAGAEAGKKCRPASGRELPGKTKGGAPGGPTEAPDQKGLQGLSGGAGACSRSRYVEHLAARACGCKVN
ncbi:photoreceptor disk component PRCD isoform X1 [Phyllostomus discolor]|uniref:Photoreceptor disk component PRCD isoform X1 n=1 Tax=Phyllostomus discolor TaxID=89673 RepID=A0A7E6EGA2_9CHIR|nr:photoreceptor disk component PRCD isoform X1 [Phyllostomus discolor]